MAHKQPPVNRRTGCLKRLSPRPHAAGSTVLVTTDHGLNTAQRCDRLSKWRVTFHDVAEDASIGRRIAAVYPTS